MNLLTMSFQAGIMILLISFIRILSITYLPQKTFSFLWGIVMCRLLIPFSLPSKLSIYSLLSFEKFPHFVDVSNTQFTPTSTDFNTTFFSLQDTSIWSFLWLLGSLSFAFCFIKGYIKCYKKFAPAQLVDNEYVIEWLKRHMIARHIEVRQSPYVNSPLTFGIIRPIILMPAQTDWTDNNKLQYVLTHEFIHIRSFDAITKIVLAVTLSIHWFNPMVWLMFYLANCDIELSCDKTVIKFFGEQNKSAYALTLISMEEQKNDNILFYNQFTGNAIYERINVIMKAKKMSISKIAIAIFVVMGTIAVFATSKLYKAELPENFDSIYIQELKNGQHLDDMNYEKVLQKFLSTYEEGKYDEFDTNLITDLETKKVYRIPEAGIQIELNSYNIPISNGEYVIVWNAESNKYFRF